MARTVEVAVDLEDGLQTALERVNRLRYAARTSPEWSALEEVLDAVFGTGVRLAVYGTLAPGAPNHQVLDEVQGRWSEGAIRGDLHTVGWGSVAGYPALRWDEGASEVPIHLLVSEDLRRNWERLDEFEGPGYQRILAPVYDGGRIVAVANVYEARR